MNNVLFPGIEDDVITEDGMKYELEHNRHVQEEHRKGQRRAINQTSLDCQGDPNVTDVGVKNEGGLAEYLGYKPRHVFRILPKIPHRRFGNKILWCPNSVDPHKKRRS